MPEPLIRELCEHEILGSLLQDPCYPYQDRGHPQQGNRYALYTISRGGIGHGDDRVVGSPRPLPHIRWFEVYADAPLGQSGWCGSSCTSWTVVGHDPLQKDRTCDKVLLPYLRQ